MSLIDILKSFSGIGDVLAKKLAIKFKSKLEKVTSSEVRKILKDNIEILPTITQYDIKYNPLKKIPRSFISNLEKEISKYLKGVKFTFAGSYIREKSFSSDLDIVICTKYAETFWDTLVKLLNNSPIKILEPYAKGKFKISTFIKVPYPNFNSKTHRYIKVDFFLTSPENYITTLNFAIGSGAYNIRVRAVAKKRGFILNQYGLFKDDKKIPLKNEHELFKTIGVTYREPKDRIK